MTRIGNVYRWIHGRMVNRPTNYSWIIKGELAGSGLPITYSQILWVIKNGIKTIITVREVPLPAQWFTNNINRCDNNGNNLVEYVHLKVEDYGAPHIEQLDITVEYIKKRINSGKPVMVHCAAGKGRTGTILAAYLLKEENLDADKAIMMIRKLRPGSVQSETQKKCIEAYEQYFKRHPKTNKL